jgi:hypothetical protein
MSINRDVPVYGRAEWTQEEITCELTLLHNSLQYGSLNGSAKNIFRKRFALGESANDLAYLWQFSKHRHKFDYKMPWILPFTTRIGDTEISGVIDIWMYLGAHFDLPDNWVALTRLIESGHCYVYTTNKEDLKHLPDLGAFSIENGRSFDVWEAMLKEYFGLVIFLTTEGKDIVGEILPEYSSRNRLLQTDTDTTMIVKVPTLHHLEQLTIHKAFLARDIELFGNFDMSKMPRYEQAARKLIQDLWHRLKYVWWGHMPMSGIRIDHEQEPVLMPNFVKQIAAYAAELKVT